MIFEDPGKCLNFQKCLVVNRRATCKANLDANHLSHWQFWIILYTKITLSWVWWPNPVILDSLETAVKRVRALYQLGHPSKSLYEKRSTFYWLTLEAKSIFNTPPPYPGTFLFIWSYSILCDNIIPFQEINSTFSNREITLDKKINLWEFCFLVV